MDLVQRLLQIEQLAAYLQSEAMKVRKEIEKGERNKRKNEDLDKQVAAIMAQKRENYKVIYK